MNRNSDEINRSKERKIWLKNYIFSIIIHLILFVSLIYFLDLSSNSARINSIIFSLDTQEYQTEKTFNEKEKSNIGDVDEIPEPPLKEADEIRTVSFTDIQADTTNLEQFYTEPTLNVKMKYPRGWTFIDQNKNKKLEGVTFWLNDGSVNPPPYLHLEVVDKDMFIEKRYQYKTDFEKYTAYYNDPEELQDYFTQIIYLRTEDNEDFRLKIMIKGKNDFYLFQPRFWAILKSFDFGNDIF
ncbi:MAG: hypothetical protein RBR74_11940 [Ignavibacteriaceae bacterium]|jgi:hypothetical protein|nr:hypothetical protein [Ignavibacteriaceae bacterium]